MKNKKAFLLGEYTLKTIIAVLCLLLLFYLLFVIYRSYQDSKNLDMAKASLEELGGKMKIAKETGKEQSMVLLEPKSWVIISYTGSKKPLKCTENCICICTYNRKGPYRLDTDLSLCNSLGQCINFNDNVNKLQYQIRKSTIEFLEGIIISSANELSITYKDGEFIIVKK